MEKVHVIFFFFKLYALIYIIYQYEDAQSYF